MDQRKKNRIKRRKKQTGQKPGAIKQTNTKDESEEQPIEEQKVDQTAKKQPAQQPKKAVPQTKTEQPKAKQQKTKDVPQPAKEQQAQPVAKPVKQKKDNKPQPAAVKPAQPAQVKKEPAPKQQTPKRKVEEKLVQPSKKQKTQKSDNGSKKSKKQEDSSEDEEDDQAMPDIAKSEQNDNDKEEDSDDISEDSSDDSDADNDTNVKQTNTVVKTDKTGKSDNTDKSGKTVKSEKSDKSDKSDKSKSELTRVYCGNLPYSLSQDEVLDLFKDYNIESSEFPVDWESGKWKGFAIIDLKPDEAKKSVEKLNGMSVLSRSITVREFVPEPTSSRNVTQKKVSDTFRVQCSNLSSKCTEEDLKALLSNCGEIADLYFPRTKKNGPKGFAYVTFYNDEAVQEALKLDGSELKGNKIKLAQTEKPNPTKVFISNLTFSTNTKTIDRIFQEVGEIDNIFHPSARGEGKRGGYAVITFKSADSVPKAIEKTGTLIDGRKIFVRPYHDKVGSTIEGSPTPFRVIGTNFSYRASTASIEEFFSEIGEIKHIIYPKYEDTQRWMGTAVVSYGSAEEAEKALQLSGTKLDDRVISVKPFKIEPAVRVNNVDRMDSSDIHNIFGSCGEINRIYFSKDARIRSTYAVIIFQDEEAVEKALDHDGSEVKGRNIEVVKTERN